MSGTLALGDYGTPPVRQPKKLVLCCDGTWLDSDNSYIFPSIIPWNPTGHVSPPSNTTHISRALKPVDAKGRPQIAYYQAGLGTGWTLENKLLGGALGFGLSQNIREAYNFLASNHATGDEIFLIGFSRGAFTARSVGGLISSLGLLNKVGLRYFGLIFEDWLNSGVKGYVTKATENNEEGIPGFVVDHKAGEGGFLEDYAAGLLKLGLTRVVDIHAIGVFETVGALGIPTTPILQHVGLPTSLHKLKFWDTALNSRIKNAFQALALDERRASYVPCIWNKTPVDSETLLKQVWFPGVHSNIGGSYVNDGIGLLTLAWMMSQLSPFLDFEDQYIFDVFRDWRRYVAMQPDAAKLQQEYGAWGDGLIVNSARFPRSLLGTKTRTPGRYVKTDPATGDPITSQPKLDTNEMIHACVRERVIGKGTKVGGVAQGYFPQALKGWRLATAKLAPDEPVWQYDGPDAGANIEELGEDRLGSIEIKLRELFNSCT